MSIHSKILVKDRIANTERKFGSNLYYCHAYWEQQDGTLIPVFFTRDGLMEAAERARLNTEDIKPPHLSWMQRLKSFFAGLASNQRSIR